MEFEIPQAEDPGAKEAASRAGGILPTHAIGLTTHARQWFARMLIDGSPLFDEQLVDPDGLRLAVRRLAEEPYREDGDAQLLEVLDLHFAAQAFL